MSPLTEPTRLTLAKGQPVPNDPNFAFNSLLLHGNGTNGSTVITDSSGSPKTVTAVGNAQISTAQSKFGGSSIAFDGTADYLTTASDPSFGFGTADFTVEAWVYLNLLDAGDAIVDFRTNTTPNFPLLWQSSGALHYNTSGSNRISISGLESGVFYHVALSRNGGQSRLFLNGVQGGVTYSDSGNYGATGIPTIGAIYTTSGGLNGYINDLRITKGVARYTSNFTPPTAPFPDF